MRTVEQLDVVEARILRRGMQQFEIPSSCGDAFAFVVDLFKLQQAMVARA